MSHLNKVMFPTVFFLLIALLFPNVAIIAVSAITFVWGFLTSFFLMFLLITYMFFSRNKISTRLVYYKEGYRNGYEDKQSGKDFNDEHYDIINKNL